MLRPKTIVWMPFALLLICGTSFTLFATTQHLYKEEDSGYFALTMLVLSGLAFLTTRTF